VIGGVLIPGQVSRGHESDCHGVAEHHLCRRGSDRREIEGAQFPLERQMHVHIADGSESIVLDGGKGDEVHALGAYARNEAEKLFGVAGLAEQNDDVARERMPMSPWSASRGERKDERMLRETRV
jgi:hypothetical protein